MPKAKAHARGDALNEQSGGLLVAKADKGYARSPDVRSQFHALRETGGCISAIGQGEPAFSDKKAVANKKRGLFENLKV